MPPLNRVAGIALGLLAVVANSTGADPPREPKQEGAASRPRAAWCRAFIEAYTSQPIQPSAPSQPDQRVLVPRPERPLARSGPDRRVSASFTLQRSAPRISALPASVSQGVQTSAPLATGLRIYPSLTRLPSGFVGTGVPVYPSPPWVGPGLRSYADAMAVKPGMPSPCVPDHGPRVTYILPPGATVIILPPPDSAKGAGAAKNTLRNWTPRSLPHH